MRLCYCLWRDCFIKNSSGIFHCRISTNDPLIVSELHESQLKKYFNEFKDGNFVDIGAHIGKYTIQIGHQLQSKGRVIAIEAQPRNFYTLINNIKLNGLENVIALNIACYSENAKLQLYRDSESTATTSYSIVEKFQGDHIMIQAKKLDDVLREIQTDKVDFLKIDAEGAEAEILEGSKQLLGDRNILKIIFEGGNQENVARCTKLLDQYGYITRGIEIGYYLAELKSV